MNESNEKKQTAALWFLGILVVILIAIIVGLFMIQAQTKNRELKAKDEKILQIEQELAQVKNQLQQAEQKNYSQDNTLPSNSIETNLLSQEKIDEILGNESTRFCVTNVSEQEDEYILTAYLLSSKPRNITEEEYQTILNGGEIEFRNLKWKFEKYMGELIYLKSGNKLLLLDKAQSGAYLSNPTDKITKLHDFSGGTIKFKVDKNILICDYSNYFRYDENGNLQQYYIDTYTDSIKNENINFLVEINNLYADTEQECKAFVKNGKVEAIQQCY